MKGWITGYLGQAGPTSLLHLCTELVIPTRTDCLQCHSTTVQYKFFYVLYPTTHRYAPSRYALQHSSTTFMNCTQLPTATRKPGPPIRTDCRERYALWHSTTTFMYCTQLAIATSSLCSNHCNSLIYYHCIIR